MKEELLHYIWKYQCFEKKELVTNDGSKLEIIHPGQHNHDAGPDFFNAKIRLDGVIWAGNVEIHVYQSDWKKHKHQEDTAYQNIILHVCYFYDVQIPELDRIAPTFMLNGSIKPGLLEKYKRLQLEQSWIPCSKMIEPEILTKELPFFSNALAVNRIGNKIKLIKKLDDTYKSDWQSISYILLGRAFGSRVNRLAFERLLASVSYKKLMKHKDQKEVLEAILLGQSGLLPRQSEQPYIQELIKEYNFYKRKYQLTPLPSEIWKYSKLRPPNFPEIKIVQFAHFIAQFPNIFDAIIHLKNPRALLDQLDIYADGYWKEHYRIEQKSKIARIKKLSRSFCELLLINAVVPLIFYYGKKINNLALTEKALNFLEEMPAEKNAITKRWENLGYSAQNALESQALIELKKNYCDTFQCLQCRIGINLINA